MKPLARMRDRLHTSKDDSDVAFFGDLLLYGELLMKLQVAGMVASLEEERERHRYRLEHQLVRADGLGVWAETATEIFSGSAYHALCTSGKTAVARFSEKGSTGSWQYECVQDLATALSFIPSARREKLAKKLAARDWFGIFAELRNKTRGHGAVLPTACSASCEPLFNSLQNIAKNSPVLNKEWAFLRQNLSRKYRVSPISEQTESFTFLRTSTEEVYSDGVYVDWEVPRKVNLVYSDPDLKDFFFPNGRFKTAGFEVISYGSGQVELRDSSPFLDVPGSLPESATQGKGELDVIGEVFTNLPKQPSGYVARLELESDLFRVLLDDRHPAITLVGRGGIGKTSTALKAAYDLTSGKNFGVILWFSARDIELEASGPRPVQPHVLTEHDIAEEYVRLLKPNEASQDGFSSLDFFRQQLGKESDESTLFVFDNFETVSNPADLFAWLDSAIRVPNKILITTRHRDFRGDYHVEVEGMTEQECQELIRDTWSRLGTPYRLSGEYVAELIDESGGHPYVLKILLGEAADGGRQQKVKRIIGRREDILDALFDRTFGAISSPARRVFLTLSAWRTSIPLLLVEAVLNRPDNERIDVEKAVNELSSHSFIEVEEAEDGQRYLGLPLPAFMFGKKKLSVSPQKASIAQDVELLRLAGVGQGAELQRGVDRRVYNLFRGVAQKASLDHRVVEEYRSVLEAIASGYPPAWLWLADLYVDEVGGRQGDLNAIDCITRYIENNAEDDPDISWKWRRLAELYEKVGNKVGMHHARVEMCMPATTPFRVLQTTANSLNATASMARREIDIEAFSHLLRTFAVRFADRIDEGDAKDYSRLGWLWWNANDRGEARKAVLKGLELDPKEDHLLGILKKLDEAENRIPG